MIDLYQDQAQSFDSYASAAYPWRFIECPALTRHLQGIFRPGMKVLDAGCGSGRVTQFLLSQNVQASDIVGLDSSAELLKIAQARFPDVRYYRADIAEQLPEIDTVGFVVCTQVFAQLSDAQLLRALRNFWQVLTPGGSVVYSLAHPLRYVDDESYLVQRQRKQSTPWGTVIDHFHRTVVDYLDATTKAGLQLEAIEELTVSKSGQVVPQKYEEHRHAPSRLVVRASKPEG